MPSSPTLHPSWEHNISSLCYDLAPDDGVVFSNLVEYQGLHDIIDFLIWGRSYGFQHKKGAYAYDKDTDGVMLFLKAHHIDQITLLFTYMKHLPDVEYN